MSEIRTRAPARSPLFSHRELQRDEHAPLDIAGYVLVVAVAAAVFLIAYDYGSYTEISRETLAIVVWWTIALAVAFGVRSPLRLPLAAYTLGGLVLAFAGWTMASTGWAVSAERAFSEGNRVLLYTGVFALVVLASWRGSAVRWADGLALGIAAVGLYALLSRLFPDLIDTSEYRNVLSSAYTRLSYPLGYWNGLAIFTALSFPLLLRAAVASRWAVSRGLALMPIPALVGVIYLASSRGGFATALFATFCFLLLTARRWSAIAAAGLAGVGAIGVVAVLQARSELVDHPELPAAESQGHSAAWLIAAVCLLVGVIWAAGTVLLRERLPENGLLDRAGAVLVVVAAAIGLAFAHPIQRFDQFKALPPPTPTENAVTNHLLNKSGNGRWQLWTAAMDEFRTEPLHGRGAGSFEAWWLQSPVFAGFARDAHSLYTETLGELGVIGLVLLALAFLVGAATGLRRMIGAREPDNRTTIAAALAAFAGFALAAAVDWVWELTALGVVAFVLLAVLAGPATLEPLRRRGDRTPPQRRASFAAGGTVVLLGLFAVGAAGLALVSDLEIGESQAAASRDDPAAAIDHALDARSVESWAASPYVQLALVNEQLERLRPARSWIAQAIDRDRNDWRLWIIQARIQTKLGKVPQAEASLAHARRLYPKSTLLASVALGSS